jgi:hypothetical protein
MRIGMVAVSAQVAMVDAIELERLRQTQQRPAITVDPGGRPAVD